MSVDFGDARTGIAMCDKTEFLASPITVIHEKRFEHAIEKTAAAAIENKAEAVIVGLPLNMDGTAGEKVEAVKEFAAMISANTDIPIEFHDERLSTVSAHRFLSEEMGVKAKKHKNIVDSLAAEIILQSYMDKNRKTNLS